MKKNRNELNIPSRKLLIGRLFIVLEKQIERMENTMPDTANDKEISLLGQIVRNLEKLVEMDTRQNSLPEDGQKGKASNSKKIQALRTKIYERLTGLEAE